MLVFLALGLGLMAKPMLVTLPLVLLLLDYWPLERFQWHGRSKVEELLEGESATVTYQRASPRRLILEKIPLFGLAAASSVITFVIQQGKGAVRWGETFPLSGRMSNALVCYISYIIKMIYPNRLAVLYPHPGNSLPVCKTMVCLFVLVFMSAGVIYWGRRRRYLAVGWLWYLVTLVPVIGLVQVGVQAMSDRYTYLPLVGIFIMIAWSAGELTAKWRYKRIGLGVTAGIVLTTLAICTRVQLRHWQNNLGLFGHALKVTENNYVMHSNYGGALFEEGRFDEALAHFNEALRINPKYADARRNGGIVLLRQGNIDEAIVAFAEVLSYSGDWPITHNYLGLAYAQKGEFDLAVQNYNAALRLKPNYVEAIKNLGIVLKEQGKTDEAINRWRTGLQLEPDNPDVHYNMGTVMAEQYKYDQAVNHFNVALAARPDWPEAQHNVGAVYYLQGKLDLAVQHCAEAIRLRPDYHDAHHNIAMAKSGLRYTTVSQVLFISRASSTALPSSVPRPCG
jgi:tetratricopeptide (TPR) repeat protein